MSGAGDSTKPLRRSLVFATEHLCDLTVYS